MNAFKMKTHIAIVLLLVFSLEACAAKRISWKTDGTVTVGRNTIKLDMQNVYSGFEYGEGIFIIGFKISDNKENKPTVVWVSGNNSSPQYWSFNSILKQIFIFKEKIHLLDMNGTIYSLSKNNWNKIPIKLTPKSKVVDVSNGILACYPSSPFKASNNIGACYMASGKWSIDVNWREVEPKICGEHLVVLDEKDNKKYFKKYNKITGDLVFKKEITKPPEDLCMKNTMLNL
jgi:hypothetical protein